MIDFEHAVVGSVGWTPQSLFLSEEYSVHIQDRETVVKLFERFQIWWRAASVSPKRWPVEMCGFSDLVLRQLSERGIRTIGRLLSSDGQNLPAHADELRLRAGWVAERFPASLAEILARSKVKSLSVWNHTTTAEELERALKMSAIDSSAQLAPASAYIRRMLLADAREKGVLP